MQVCAGGLPCSSADSQKQRGYVQLLNMKRKLKKNKVKTQKRVFFALSHNILLYMIFVNNDYS